MPFKGSKTHPGQAAAAKRKKQAKAIRADALQAEAEKQGVSVKELVRSKCEEAMPFKAKVTPVVTVTPYASPDYIPDHRGRQAQVRSFWW